MIALFHLASPGIGLPSLRGYFPDASKGELEYMLVRYRLVHLRHDRKISNAVTTTTAVSAGISENFIMEQKKLLDDQNQSSK